MIWVLSLFAFNPTFFGASSAFTFNLVSASSCRPFSLLLFYFSSTLSFSQCWLMCAGYGIDIFGVISLSCSVWHTSWSRKCPWHSHNLLSNIDISLQRSFVSTSYLENVRRLFSSRNVVCLVTCPPTSKGSCSFVDFARKTCQQEYKPHALLLDNSWGLWPPIVSL